MHVDGQARKRGARVSTQRPRNFAARSILDSFTINTDVREKGASNFLANVDHFHSLVNGGTLKRRGEHEFINGKEGGGLSTAARRSGRYARRLNLFAGPGWIPAASVFSPANQGSPLLLQLIAG